MINESIISAPGTIGGNPSIKSRPTTATDTDNPGMTVCSTDPQQHDDRMAGRLQLHLKTDQLVAPSADRFLIRARGSTVTREVVAGFTTFGAMSYILAVNPAILSAAGMDYSQLVIVTALASAIGTLIMALWANLPIALAPGMGNNIIFAQIVVLRLGVTPGVALAMVLVNAVLFLTLSLTGLREKIIRGFPGPIRLGIQSALGLFIAWIGLKNSGLLILHESSVAIAPLSTAATVFAYAAVLLTVLLVACRVPAALLASIVVVTLIGLIVPDGHGGHLTSLPTQVLAWPVAPTKLFLLIDLPGLATNILTTFPVLLYLFVSDFFGVTATLVGVTRRAGLTDNEGNFPSGREAYAADGIASAIGAVLGTSTVGVYVESATGVAAGGRTGLTGIVVAALFALSVFVWPLILVIPPQALAPALLVVGILMLESLGELDMTHAENSYPPLLMVVLAAATTDLVMSLASGCFLYTGIILFKQQREKLTPVLVGLDLAFLVYIVLASRVA
jgi:adenine/guanine/hypoxanthine permease